MVFGVGYFWFFENKTKSTVFDAEFKFELTNLKIEGDEDSNTWHVELYPGQTMVKKLIMVDPA